MDLSQQAWNIPGWMTSAELRCLAALAKTAQSWVEIGVAYGRSALCVGLHLPKGATLTLIDNQLGDAENDSQSLQTTLKKLVSQRPDLKIVKIRMDSIEAASRVEFADVVFLDGDHSYEGVKSDILAWQDKCRLLCGHDYGRAGVIAAVGDLLPAAEVAEGSIWKCETRNNND